MNLDPAQASAEVDKAVGLIASRTAPLWKSLSSCILRVEDNLRAVLPQHMHAAGETAGNAAARLLPPGAQQVLPLVEAFFVLCALQGAIPAPPSQAKDLLSAPSMDASALRVMAPASSTGSSAARGATPPPAAVAAAGGAPGSGSQLSRLASSSLSLEAPGGADANCLPFLRFAERHRRLLNAYIRRNTGLLESSLAPLLRVPKLIDFDNKRAYFRSKVRSPDERAYAGTLRLAVKRSSVFEDSFNKLRSKSPQEMRGKLSVAFVGEEGIDAGGVSREWYQVMAREIFNPNLALFVSVPEGGTTFQPNPNSVVQSDTGVSHLEFFKFVGRLVGKALYDGQIMDAYFTRSFYKHMLGQPLTYEDIEAVDPEYYKNLKWMLENDITDVLDLTFTAESDFFGKTEIVELVPGGREFKVTEANKHEYVNLIARHRMTTSIKAQIQAFLEGFWQLVPRELVAIFNDHELELLISGLPDIDVADLRANCEYTGFSPNSPVIQWFWQLVGDMDKQDLALLLQFVTGTSKVPLGGFRALQGISGPQRFQIHKSYGAADRLPSAHTCFNQLDLPEYGSKEQLGERLAMAIHEGHEGFGFG